MVIKEFTKLFNEFNKAKIDYCILRNYEFMLKKEPYQQDLDIILKSKDKKKVEKILRSNNYRHLATLFHEEKYKKYISDSQILLRLHLHYDFLHYHKLPILFAKPLLMNKKKLKNFFIPSDKDFIIELVLHSLFGKKFKEKYKKLINSLMKQADKKYIYSVLAEHYSPKIAHQLLIAICNEEYNNLINLRRRCFFVLLNKKKKNLIIFLLSRLQHYVIHKTKRLRRPRVFAFVGPDGSGKTTLINELTKILDKNLQKYRVVYMGRWRNKSSVRKVLAKRRYLGTKNSKSIFRQILWVTDMYSRWVKFRFGKEKLILTDRYSYDLLTPGGLTGILKTVYSVTFPRSDLVFFLYHEPEVLAKRKKEDIKKIKKKIESIDYILSRFGNKVIKIKTNNIHRNVKEIAERIL